jgi:hypothetical protein
MYDEPFLRSDTRRLAVTASCRSRIDRAATLISLAACGAAMLLSGCAGNPPHDLMPAPAAYEQAETPFGAADAAGTPAGSGEQEMPGAEPPVD